VSSSLVSVLVSGESVLAGSEDGQLFFWRKDSDLSDEAPVSVKIGDEAVNCLVGKASTQW